MNYQESVTYLEQAASFGIKPGLERIQAILEKLGHPETAYRTIHVTGTNGKGSVVAMITSVLENAQLKIGRYVSPHLIDYTERIYVGGHDVTKETFAKAATVVKEAADQVIAEGVEAPTEFELLTAMAFWIFREEKVDYAVVEVGMGGLYDSTNVILPVVSIITNVAMDHMKYLGNTLEEIAHQKAGIIKKGVPVLLGEAEKRSVFDLFQNEARKAGAPFHYALSMGMLEGTGGLSMVHWKFPSVEYGEVIGELAGEVQQANAITVFSALHLLREKCGVDILPEAVHEGFGHVTQLTGLMGRWQTLRTKPTVICDTGHNVGGWKHIAEHLNAMRSRFREIYMIVGMVNDKDIDGVLSLMPPDASYFFTQASVERAMPVKDFAMKAMRKGLPGVLCETVEEAVEKALKSADKDDLIFIGGSTFIVADALPLFMKEDEYK